MNKKLIIAMSSLSFLLVACVNEEVKQVETNQAMMVKRQMPVVYNGLLVDVESYVEGEKIMVKTVVQNNGEEEIPLHYQDEKLATITVSSKDTIHYEEDFLSEKESLMPKEKIVFEQSYALPSEDEEYVVNTLLHLEDTNDIVYKKEELRAMETFKIEKKNDRPFLPKKRVTYVYENTRADKVTKQEETFLYFQDGFIQSYDSEEGVKVYYADQKGLYYAYTNSNKTKDNVINQVDYNKKMILIFPAVKGATWDQDGVHFEITATDKTIQTNLGTFNNVVEVTSEFGTGVRYYFHEQMGLLQIDVKNGDKWETTRKLIDKK